MKRTLLTLALGLAVGLGTHVAYFQLHRPAATDTLDGQLAWMRTELSLTDDQYLRIKELHQASGPRLRAIAAQVAELQTEYLAFDRTRRTSDRVDFLEFARYVEIRRHVSRESADSTRQLVQAAAGMMTPPQRQRYLQLIATVEPLARPLPN